jgi:hypothetical protein
MERTPNGVSVPVGTVGVEDRLRNWIFNLCRAIAKKISSYLVTVVPGTANDSDNRE